jgi:hypothetical protein
VFLLKAKNFGVELQGLVLIVNEYARQFDLHGFSFLFPILGFAFAFERAAGAAARRYE